MKCAQQCSDSLPLRSGSEIALLWNRRQAVIGRRKTLSAIDDGADYTQYQLSRMPNEWLAIRSAASAHLITSNRGRAA